MSLRTRLLLGLGLVAVILVAVALVVTRTTRDDLTARVDDQLLAAAEALPAGGGRRPGGPPGEPAGPVEAPGPSNLWLQTVRDGEVDATVTRFDEAGPVLSEADLAALVAAPGEGRTVSGEGADRFRVMALVRSPEVTVIAGLPLDDVDASVSRLIVVEVVATGVVLLVLGLVASWVLALGVRPLKRMTAAATDIAAGDLSVRVPEADPRTEAGELGVALNEMLNRMEVAFGERDATEQRLRRFVADASHELRTPITTIRGYAELHRRGGLEDPDERRAAMARTEQEAVRMGALVEDLLLLARLDEGRPLASEVVDLDVLAADAVADAAVAHPHHRLRTLARSDATSARVVGDDHRLRQVLANVVGNAVQHTPPGTEVEVSVRPDPGSATVTVVVSDDGPGLSPAVADRAFERFARGDEARGRASGRTGLGLAIVAALVEAHGGTVALASDPGAGTIVSITLPAAPPAAGEAPRPLAPA